MGASDGRAFAAALFDMDGVLVDTAESVVTFWRTIGGDHGVTITDDDLGAHVYGRTADDTLDALFPTLSPEHRRGVHARMIAYEAELTYRPVAGARALLSALKEFGIPAVLVTSGTPEKVERVVAHLDIAGLLTTYVTSADISRGKPDPEPFLIGARKAGVPAQRCLAFEDAVGGVRSAVVAGTTCIGIGGSEMHPVLLEAGAIAVVPDLTAVCLDGKAGSRGNDETWMDIGGRLRLPLATA